MNTNALQAFDPSKPVRCRNGANAEIFRVCNDGGTYPIYGRYRYTPDGPWVAASWRSDGHMDDHDEMPNDLVNVPLQGNCWVLVRQAFPNSPVWFETYTTRDEAMARTEQTIAHIHVPWVEGMGLEPEFAEVPAAEAQSSCPEKPETSPEFEKPWRTIGSIRDTTTEQVVAETARAELTEQARATSPMGRCGPLAGRPSEDSRLPPEPRRKPVGDSKPLRNDCQGENSPPGFLRSPAEPIYDVRWQRATGGSVIGRKDGWLLGWRRGEPYLWRGVMQPPSDIRFAEINPPDGA